MLDGTIPTGAVYLAGCATGAFVLGLAVVTGKRLRTMQPPEVPSLRPFGWMDRKDERDAAIAGHIDTAPELVYHQSLRELREAHDHAPHGGSW